MNPNLTELVYIIDRSGSMNDLTMDAVGGYNAFIAEQKNLSGEAKLTTILFDDEYEVFCDRINIQEAKEMSVKDCAARGFTSLMDAIGKTINSIGRALENTEEENRPSKVLFMIMTDGYENSSQEFSRADVRRMIEHQQSVYSWQFLFIGAGIDAYKEAASIGISKEYTASTYATGACVVDSIAAFSKGASMCRSGGGGGGSLDESWKSGVYENVSKTEKGNLYF